MTKSLFRWCLFVAAGCLALAAVFQLGSYVAASVAVANSGLRLELQQSVRALWLGAALQSLFLAGLFALAGSRPGWVSRPVVVLCGLLPIASAALFFALVGSGWGQAMSGLAALAVAIAALLWPSPTGTRP